MSDGATKIKNGLFLKPVSADPSNPAEGDIQFSDGTARAKGLWVYKDGAWSEAGGSGQGGINYLEGDNSDFEAGVGDWVAYADADQATPEDGTGGSPTTTIAKSSDTSLRGSNNGLITKSAFDDRGEGASCNFTIDEADQAKKLTISFDYTTSANYADDDIGIFIYDVTNANLIRVNGEDLKANANSATHYAQFQTAPDSTSYRLILHVVSENTSAYTVRIDNVKVGPTNLAYGTVVTDWETYTPTITGWDQNNSATGEYRRVGDSIEVRFKITVTGDPDSSTGNSVKVSLPSGLSIDTAKLPATTYMPLGIASLNDITNNSFGAGMMYYDSTTAIRVNYLRSSTIFDYPGVTDADPFTWANGDFVYGEFSVPIQGWSSNAQISEDLGGREIRVFGQGNDGSAITADTTNIKFTEVTDTTASWDGAVFTAPETGWYHVSGNTTMTASSNYFLHGYKNGTIAREVIGFHGSTTSYQTFGGVIQLDKGDTFSLRCNTSLTLSNNSDHTITINKLASPQTLLETETVAARYTSNSGQSINTASNTTVVYEDLDYDTHNGMNTSTGIYTIPVSGKYLIKGTITWGSYAAATTKSSILKININSTSQSTVWTEFQASSSLTYTQEVVDIINLVKGDTVEMEVYQDTGVTETLETTGVYNVFSIARIK